MCPAQGEVFTPDVVPDDGYIRQIDHFARSIQGEAVPPVITLEQSRDSVKIVEAERESIRRRERIAIR